MTVGFLVQRQVPLFQELVFAAGVQLTAVRRYEDLYHLSVVLELSLVVQLTFS
jgi:hypothetical protein